MNALLEKYKTKLSYLPVSTEERQKIILDFEKQLIIKLLDVFYERLNSDETTLLSAVTTDEELVEKYLSIIYQKIDQVDFLEAMDQVYTQVLTSAINQLPEMPVTPQKFS